MRFYYYNDLSPFKVPRIHNVRSNLCTKYYADKKKFCGNYCSRKVDKYNRRCWRHPRGRLRDDRPVVVLLMISASERLYNRDRWIKFLLDCEDQNIPIVLVIYHEDMWNCTVREAGNLVSRFRPFPDIFDDEVLPLRESHGGINYAQTNLKMLEYGMKLPNAARCIILTERTIPIRSPATIYKTFMASKCHVDISYNVKYGPVPRDLPSATRGKPFSAANNHAQGLFTVDFLKEALPTVSHQFRSFGFSRNRKGTYIVSDNSLFEQWRRFTGSNPSEFWLINSFLLEKSGSQPPAISQLKAFMEPTKENDKYSVAEIPQWRDGWKRTFVFRDPNRREKIEWFDERAKRYYKGLNFETGVSLRKVIKFIRREKRKAMFFRQVELP